MFLKAQCGVMRSKARFFEKNMPQKSEKGAKNGPEIGFFEFI